MKRNILICLALCWLNTVTGQIALTSDNQQLIEDVIKTGLFLSKQSFQICDKETGELFGLNGKKEFGIQYSVGVKVPNGFCLTDKAVRPWLYNSKYVRYKEKYDPVFYQATFSELKENAEYNSLDYASTKPEEVMDSVIYRFSSNTFGEKGFVLDSTKGKKDGWVIWVNADQNIDFEQTLNLNYIIYRKVLTVNERNRSFDINKPNTEQNVLGGIYVVPVYTAIGIVEFRLCGLILSINDEWKVCCPFVGLTNTSVTEATPRNTEAIEEENFKLTPTGKIKKEDNKDKKKKKK